MKNTLTTRLREYYKLAKPNIIYGNLVTTAAGFFFASGLAVQRLAMQGLGGHGDVHAHFYFNFLLFGATIVGTALVIGAACVFNNYIDRGIDSHMQRTKERALVRGSISAVNAIIYAIILCLCGFLILAFFTNTLTVWLEIIGFIFYIVLYGLSKRQTMYGVLVGSVAGAVPIVAGYAAFADRFDVAALLLFIILVIWQMPHFYAIALYRLEEYRAASVPVLPVEKGARKTKIEMLWYIVAFFVAVLLLTAFSYTGYIYLTVMAIASGLWVWLGVQGLAITEPLAENRWAFQMFMYSLIIIITFSIMVSIGTLLY